VSAIIRHTVGAICAVVVVLFLLPPDRPTGRLGQGDMARFLPADRHLILSAIKAT
jgi:hypothetical protein